MLYSNSSANSFSSEAQSYFITVHDELCDLKKYIIDDEDKSKGSISSSVNDNTFLQQALEITDTESPWTFTISIQSVKDYFGLCH